MYLPWILVGFNAILRGGGMNELLGILVGHTYFFLAFKYPQVCEFPLKFFFLLVAFRMFWDRFQRKVRIPRL